MLLSAWWLSGHGNRLPKSPLLAATGVASSLVLASVVWLLVERRFTNARSGMTGSVHDSQPQGTRLAQGKLYRR
jgi:peptidoglycan/LPS O-acetylase OafA/YrhL